MIGTYPLEDSRLTCCGAHHSLLVLLFEQCVLLFPQCVLCREARPFESLLQTCGKRNQQVPSSAAPERIPAVTIERVAKPLTRVSAELPGTRDRRELAGSRAISEDDARCNVAADAPAVKRRRDLRARAGSAYVLARRAVRCLAPLGAVANAVVEQRIIQR